MLELGVVTAFGSSRDGEGYSCGGNSMAKGTEAGVQDLQDQEFRLTDAAVCLKGAVADGRRRSVDVRWWKSLKAKLKSSDLFWKQ